MTYIEESIIKILTVVNAAVVESVAISNYESDRRSVDSGPWSELSLEDRKMYRDEAVELIKEIE